MKAYERWDDVQKVARPSAWLYRVGANLAASHFRGKRAERRALSRASKANSRRDHVSLPEFADALEVRAAVASLPEQQRKAVVLRYFLDLSSVDAARELDVTAGYMRVLTHRALTSLRDHYGVAVGQGADHD